MYTFDKQLIFTSLVAVVRLGNAVPIPQNTSTVGVSQLMEHIGGLAGELELVKYFKELKLDDNCKSPILLDLANFETVEINNPAPCLCTVIYNLTVELEHSRFVNRSNLEAAKSEADKFDKAKIYDYWSNAHERMSSKNKNLFQQLMAPLNTTEKWSRVCYNLVNAFNPYCKFITVEIVLFEMANSLRKPAETLKETIANVLKINKEPKMSTVMYEDLPEINGFDSVNNANIEADDTKKVDEIDNNNEEQTDVSYNKDDEVTGEELEKPVQEKPTDVKEVDVQVPTESKINLDTKETQMLFNQKNTFKSHGAEEESHFFFYFGFMTVLTMMFYLALYNKKKIIALLIEGRRSTNHRRRPNTASYSKVETDDGSTVY